MKKFIFVISICLSVSCLFAQTDRRTDRSLLSIATFNAEFLWDGLAPEEGHPDVIFPHKGDPIAADENMQNIARIVRDLNADIINLVEVESLEAQTLFTNSYLADMGYKPFLIKGKDSYTGQAVCLLTRVDPISNKVERTDEDVQVVVDVM